MLKDATPQDTDGEVLSTMQVPPRWHKVQDNVIESVVNYDSIKSYNAVPGTYFVIGSFGVWENAKNFIEIHRNLDARIVAADIADYRVFRIVVGPLTPSNEESFRKRINANSISDIWEVRVPNSKITEAWKRTGYQLELASADGN